MWVMYCVMPFIYKKVLLLNGNVSKKGKEMSRFLGIPLKHDLPVVLRL